MIDLPGRISSYKYLCAHGEGDKHCRWRLNAAIDFYAIFLAISVEGAPAMLPFHDT